MFWILPDCHADVIVNLRSIPLSLELCPNETKPPLLQISTSSFDPPPDRYFLLNRASQRNLHYEATLFIHAISIEYP